VSQIFISLMLIAGGPANRSDSNFNRISAMGSRTVGITAPISSEIIAPRRLLVGPSYSEHHHTAEGTSAEHRDRIDRPVYPRSLAESAAPDKETPPSAFLLEPIACTVAIIFDVYIISLGRSLIDSSRSPPCPLARSPRPAYQVRHETPPVPGGIDSDAQRRPTRLNLVRNSPASPVPSTREPPLPPSDPPPPPPPPPSSPAVIPDQVAAPGSRAFEGRHDAIGSSRCLDRGAEDRDGRKRGIG